MYYFVPDFNVTRTDIVSEVYAPLNKYLLDIGVPFEDKGVSYLELRDVRLEVKNPLLRVVGGFDSRHNIFVDMARGLYYVAQDKEGDGIKFLNLIITPQNQNAMFDCRLGRYLVDKIPPIGLNQLLGVVTKLSSNNNYNEAVLQVWLPQLDFNNLAGDIPYSISILLKVRDGKLYVAIYNNRNDLHSNLLSDTYLNSYLFEIVAKVLGIEFGGLVYNSQILFTRGDDVRNSQVNTAYETGGVFYKDLYTFIGSTLLPFEYSFDVQWTAPTRLIEIQQRHNSVMNKLYEQWKLQLSLDIPFEQSLMNDSIFMAMEYSLLSIYVEYLFVPFENKILYSQNVISSVIPLICSRLGLDINTNQYVVMALDYFARQIPNFYDSQRVYLGKL